MLITVKVKTKAKENKVFPPDRKLWPEKDNEVYNISVKELPVHGKANSAVEKLLAEYFKVTQRQIELVRGGTSKLKIFKIDN